VIPFEDYIQDMSQILKDHFEAERGTFAAANAENEEMKER